MLLHLMQAALGQNDGPLAWAEGCSAPSMAELIAEQSLVPMLYPVVRRQAGPAWADLAGRLKPVYDRELHRGLVQEYEIGALLDDMERDGIDCLPMKGWVMRNCYPDPLMRSMSDFDVLIRDMDSCKMQAWMEVRGYRPEHTEQEVHDTYRKPPYMNIELHRRLMEERRLKRQNTAWRENWLASLWQKSYRLEGKKHLYRLTASATRIFWCITCCTFISILPVRAWASGRWQICISFCGRNAQLWTAPIWKSSWKHCIYGPFPRRFRGWHGSVLKGGNWTIVPGWCWTI